MTTKKEPQKEEKLNISKVAVSNKEKELTIVHDESRVMPSDKILICTGISKTGNQPVHPDFLDELQLLVPHLLMICEVPGHKNYTADYLKKKKAIGDNDIAGYFVSGYSVTANGLINLVGGIKTANGKVTSMTAPLTSLDLENSQYTFVKELNVIKENIEQHVHDYFIDGKFGQGAQSELDLNLETDLESQKK